MDDNDMKMFTIAIICIILSIILITFGILSSVVKINDNEENKEVQSITNDNINQ